MSIPPVDSRAAVDISQEAYEAVRENLRDIMHLGEKGGWLESAAGEAIEYIYALRTALTEHKAALQYIFGTGADYDWSRITSEKLVPPWPMPEHIQAMGLVHVSVMNDACRQWKEAFDEKDAACQQARSALTARDEALREAEAFVYRHSEPWYTSGQELLAKIRAALEVK